MGDHEHSHEPIGQLTMLALLHDETYTIILPKSFYLLLRMTENCTKSSYS